MKKILTLLGLLLSVAVTAQNVGIGTNSPTQQLDVNGNLRVRNLGNSTGQTSSMVQVDAEGVLKLAKIDTVRANPTPTQTGTAPTGTGATNDYPSAIAISGSKICVVNYRSNTIELFEVSAGSPVPLGSAIITPPASGHYHPSDVAIRGHKAYVISELAGALLSLQIFDISGNVPVQLNATAVGECWRIIIRGTKAYITTVTNRLEVYDLSGATPSLLGFTATGAGSRDFVLVGNKAYVINQSANALQVFDITSDNPSLAATVNTGFQPWAVTSDGARVYVANRAGQSIEVFDISSAQPVSVGTTTLPYMPERIQLSGSRAYVIGANNLINVYDIAGRLKPVLIGSAPLSNPAAVGKSLVITGRKAFVGTSDKKLEAFDLGYTGGITVQGPDGNLLVIPDATIGGDNLGDHNITQNLNLRNFQLVGNEGTSGIGIANDGTVTLAKGLNVGGNINLGTNQLVGGGASGLMINSAGNVGIGTNNPTYKLDITGNSRLTGDLIHTSADGGGTWSYLTNTSGQGVGWKFVARPSATVGTGGELSILNSNNLELLTLKQTGNLGIGTADPHAPLQMGNSLGRKIVLFEDGNNDHQYYGLAVEASTLRYQSKANHVFYSSLSNVSSKEVFRLNADGRIGVGVANPSCLLSNTADNMVGISGVGLGAGSLSWQMNAAGYTQGLFNANTTAGANGLLVKIAGTTSSNRILDLSVGSSQGAEGTSVLVAQGDGKVGINTKTPGQALSVVGNITATGSITSSSDIRLKKDVQPLTNALASVMRIQPVYYYWKTEEFPAMQFTVERQLGFSAQEIESLFPELVLTDTQGFKSVDYSRLAPVLVQALKEQQARIEKQEKAIQLLMKEIKALKRQLAK